MFELVAKIHGDARKYAWAKTKEINKAMITAIKVEAFAIRKEGAADLRKNQLRLELLEKLEKKNGRKTRKGKPKAPLKNFAKGITYKVDYKNLKGWVGFIGNRPGTSWQAKMVEQYSKTSKINYDAAMVKKLHKRGIHIRKDTVSAVVPIRDVIGAMLTITARDSGKNIQKNFYRKLAGERI